MKRVVFLAIFIIASFCALAQTITAQGSCGNSLTWVLTSDSTLTISGSDTMPDYYDWSGGTPWDAYKSVIATVIIGDSVTTIGRSAFKDCINLTSVTIPISVTSIGASAFHQCVKLPSITIPDSVISIGNNAFTDCMSLISVSIGNRVKTIGMWAFSLCKSLISVTIPNSVTSIGGAAFAWCYDLEEVTLSNSLTTIEGTTFSWCTSLTSITIPNNVTIIYTNAFSFSGLTHIEIGSSVKEIHQWAFDGCSGLRSITLHATTPPSILFNYVNQVFQNVPDTIPIYIPCGTYNDYSTASGWDYFSNFIEPTTDTGFYSAIFLQGETYSDSNFTNLTEAGRYCITLQNDNGCDSVVCLELRYDNMDVVPITDYELLIMNYEIYDMLGRNLTASLRGLSVAEVRSNPEALSLLERAGGEVLPAGIYIIKIQTNRGVFTKKVINIIH